MCSAFPRDQALVAKGWLTFCFHVTEWHFSDTRLASTLDLATWIHSSVFLYRKSLWRLSKWESDRQWPGLIILSPESPGASGQPSWSRRRKEEKHSLIRYWARNGKSCLMLTWIKLWMIISYKIEFCSLKSLANVWYDGGPVTTTTSSVGLAWVHVLYAWVL